MLSIARAWISVILAGKRESRRHSTTSFSENVVMAKTSYQTLEVLSLCDWERVLSKRRGEKGQWSLSGSLFFENTQKNLKANLVVVVVLVLKPKGLFCVQSANFELETFISSLSSPLTREALASAAAVPRACFYGWKGRWERRNKCF